MRLWTAAALFLVAGVGPAQDTLSVLEPDGEVPPRRMLRTYLHNQAQKHFDARRLTVATLKTPEAIRQRQQELRAKFIEALGGFPEKTPLNPRVVGKEQRDGYRIEKVIYESRPEHHVTATLYLPEGKPPFPGVIMPIGHSNNGKAADYVQRGSILLAKNGLAVLAYDPIGQGERRQLLDDQHRPAIPSSTSEHTLTGVGALLVGRCTASYRIWDGIRSIDYLTSRPEVDAKRIGCTGCSGGGTLTSYLMALDDRILAAAPSCYITSLERLFATIGPQDAEQNIPGQVAFGMEHADYLTQRAPRPTLLCAATHDFFDIQGTWTTFREAKRLYGALGHAERVDLMESDTKHGYPRSHREAVAEWMKRWLLKIDEPVSEGEFPIAKDAELLCTRTGQVLEEFKGKSVFHLNAERERQLAKERADRPRTDLRADVTQFLALPQSVPVAKLRDAGEVRRDGYRIRKLAFETEPGVTVPGLLYDPVPAKNGPLVLYVHGDGKAAAAGPGGPLEELVRAGRRVLAVDLRGFGETAPGPAPARRAGFFGTDFHESFVALHLSRPLLGQRVYDLLAVAAQASADSPDGIHLVAIGSAGPAGLHAAALNERIRQVTLEQSLVSWSAVVHTPLSQNQLTNAVPGVLQAYDLPDLAAALAPRPLTIRQAADPTGKPLSRAAAEEAYAPVKAAYGRHSAEKNLALVADAGAAPAEGAIFAPGATLKVEAEGGVGGEGPAWHPELGVLSSGNGNINQLDRGGKSSIYRKSAGTNGLLFDRQGRLLACEPARHRVTRTEPNGQLTVLTDTYQGKRYNQPNDLTVDSKGRIYFSDPRYGPDAGKELLDEQGRIVEGVYRIDPDGSVTRVLGRAEVSRPNGVLVSADDRFLFVADNDNNHVGGARKLWRFDLRPDGTVDLPSCKLLHDWGTGRGPDGLKQDQQGRLYVAGGLNKPHPPFEPAEDRKGGIYVFSPDGKLLTFLPVPRDEVTNCAFGGDDLKTLYITGGGTLYSIRTTTPGRVVYPPAKPAR